jgi:hypothetical protein
MVDVQPHDHHPSDIGQVPVNQQVDSHSSILFGDPSILSSAKRVLEGPLCG